MLADVEALLGELGNTWQEAAPPISLHEVQNRPSHAIDIPSGPDHGDAHSHGRGWLVSACAVLVVGTVAALAFIARDDAEGPVITIDTAPPSTSTPPITTAPPPPPTMPPDSIPLEAYGAGAWWPVGRLAAGCRNCTGIVLDDGRVAIIEPLGVEREVVQLFDPKTATFSVAARLPDATKVDGIIQLDDDRLLLTGNRGNIAVVDPDDGSVEVVQSDGAPVSAHQLSDGRVLLFGQSDVSVLDLTTHAITRLADIGGSQREGVAPRVLIDMSDGTVLAADHHASHLFDPDSGSLRPLGDGTIRIHWASPLLDGRLLLVRGDPDDDTFTRTTTQIYDHSTGTFTDAGSWTPAAVLNDGRILELSMPASLEGSIQRAAVHDLDTGTVQEIAPTTKARTWTEAIVLPDGRILAVGGYAGHGAGSLADQDTAEVFAVADPGLPEDCCPGPTSDQIAVVAELSGESLTPLLGDPLRVRVTVPPGALSGAVRGSYWGADNRVGGGGEGSDLTLPSDCEQGCEFDIPWSITPTSPFGSVGARLVIVYGTKPPPEAEGITITIEPQPSSSTTQPRAPVLRP
jgi:hypothetical protein